MNKFHAKLRSNEPPTGVFPSDLTSTQATFVGSEAGTLALIALVWLVSRVGLLLSYSPGIDPDSETYLLLARQIAGLDFTDYNGQRTPGYPILLLATGSNPLLIWIIQSLMSLGTAILLFLLARAHGSSRALALVIALTYLLVLNTLFYESAVLTETASAFLLVLVSYLFLKAVRQGMTPLSATGLGLAVAALVLTRPQYIFMIPLIGLLAGCLRGRRWLAILAFMIVSSLPVIGWMNFNKHQIGQFSLTSLLGYNLSNHTGAFMEKASDEHSLFRDIYVKYRDEKMRETGGHQMTIFRARDELKQASGLGEVGLSARFQRISVELIGQNPMLYGVSVAKAWASFWAVPRYGQRQNIHGGTLATAFDWIWKIQHPLLRLLNAVFLVCSALLALQMLRTWKQGIGDSAAPAFMATVVLATSVVQALAEYGENPRYFIPSQPLVIAATALALLVLVHTYRRQPVEKVTA